MQTWKRESKPFGALGGNTNRAQFKKTRKSACGDQEEGPGILQGLRGPSQNAGERSREQLGRGILLRCTFFTLTLTMNSKIMINNPRVCEVSERITAGSTGRFRVTFENEGCGNKGEDGKNNKAGDRTSSPLRNSTGCIAIVFYSSTSSHLQLRFRGNNLRARNAACRR